MLNEAIHPHGSPAQAQQTLQRLLDLYQHDFPLSPTPYADMARQLGLDEQTLLQLLEALQQQGIISRVGAVFRPHRVGVSTLAAMAVPPGRLQQVAEQISAYPAVNHNYQREHHFNLWFVVTAENQQQLQHTLAHMEQHTGIRLLSLPMEKEYHIDLGFPLQLLTGDAHE